MPWYLWFLAGMTVGVSGGYVLCALAFAARDGDR